MIMEKILIRKKIIIKADLNKEIKKYYKDTKSIHKQKRNKII